MSNDEKRSGVRDIRTLRERLGKVKQSTASETTEAAHQNNASSGLLPPKTEAPSAKTESSAAAPFQSPITSPADQSAPVASPASSAEAQFAHPLQVGTYVQASDAQGLSAADIAELEEYERKHSGRTKVIASVGSSLLLVGLLFGYLSGSTMDARNRHNFAIETARTIQNDLVATRANILAVQEAMNGEVKRLEGLQAKMTEQLKAIKKAKDAKDADAANAAKTAAFAIKATIDKGVDFPLVASKMPTELKVSTASLLKQSHALSSPVRKQLGSFLLEADRYFRSVGMFQKTAKAIGRMTEVANKRFGPVLAIDTSIANSPAFRGLPKSLQAGGFVRFNREFVDTLNDSEKTLKVGNEITVFGLAVPDDGPSTSTATKKLVAISTADAVNVSAQVYPAILQLLMVQFQELEELGKSLNASSDTLNAMLEELAKQDTKFTL